MKIGEAFPSNYLKATDLGGREWDLTMASVQMEDIGSDHKPVLYFHGADKGLVLNKTNAEMIILMYGDETNNWSGQKLRIKPDKTQFQGRIVDCIRVVWTQRTAVGGVMPADNGQAPLGNGQAAPAAPLAAAPAFPESRPIGGMGGQAMTADAGTGLDDEIPF